MRILKERPKIIANAQVGKIAPVHWTSRIPGQPGENPGGGTAGTVPGVGKPALLKIAGGIAWLGSVLSGPPMSEHGRFRNAAIAFEIQKHSGIAASWPQFPSR